MKKKAALIITHGNFGKELLKSVELIMGEQENADALGLNYGESVDGLRNETERILVENQNAGKDTILFVDILGGSPSNVALYLLKKYNGIKLLMGINMPMLIEFFQSREFDELDDLVAKILSSGTEGIRKFESNKEG